MSRDVSKQTVLIFSNDLRIAIEHFAILTRDMKVHYEIRIKTLIITFTAFPALTWNIQRIPNWTNNWNNFCIELYSSRGKVYFYMNNERLFTDKKIAMKTLPHFTSITIQGNSFLRQAAIFSVGAENITSGMNGDIVPWNISLWGSYKSYKMPNISSQTAMLSNLLFVPFQANFKAAVNICKKLGNGEIAEIKDPIDQIKLLEFYNQSKLMGQYFLIPYSRNVELENFTNIYTKAPAENLNFKRFDLNQNCVACDFKNHTCSTFYCQNSLLNFICNIKSALILRGFGSIFLYPVNKFNNFFWTNDNASFVITYHGTQSQWVLWTTQSTTWATSNAPFGMT